MREPLKIWWVNHYALPPDGAGGTRHYSFAREFVSRGHEAVVVSCSFDHATGRETRLAEGEPYRLETIDGVRFLWLRAPSYRGNNLARLWNMVVFGGRVWSGRGLRNLAKPDVVIGSSPHLFAAVGAAKLARTLRVPFVLEVRDLWPQTLRDLGKLSAIHPAVQTFGYLERYLYRRARRIVTLLPKSAEYIESKGAQPRSTVCIPNGVDRSLLPPSAPPPEDETFNVLYAGSHGVANGLDSIIEAAEILERTATAKPVLFRFLGDGPEKKRLMEKVRSRDLRRVRFDPPVEKRSVYRVLQGANAFVATLCDSPLYRWGMSLNKLYDYMACGRPVVFGAHVNPDPVADADGGFSVSPENSAEIAAAICRLTEMSPEERWAMGRRGRDYVLRRHDLGTLATQFLEVLEDVIRQYRENPGHAVKERKRREALN